MVTQEDKILFPPKETQAILCTQKKNHARSFGAIKHKSSHSPLQIASLHWTVGPRSSRSSILQQWAGLRRWWGQRCSQANLCPCRPASVLRAWGWNPSVSLQVMAMPCLLFPFLKDYRNSGPVAGLRSPVQKEKGFLMKTSSSSEYLIPCPSGNRMIKFW